MPENRIRVLAEQFVIDIERETRVQVQEAVKRIVDGIAPSPPKSAPAPRAKAVTSSPKKPKHKRAMPVHCVYNGCTEKHMGPKHSYLCRKHYDEREKKA